MYVCVIDMPIVLANRILNAHILLLTCEQNRVVISAKALPFPGCETLTVPCHVHFCPSRSGLDLHGCSVKGMLAY